MQKSNITIIKLLFGLLFVGAIVWAIQDLINSKPAAATDAVPALINNQPQEDLFQASTTITPTNCRYGVSTWSSKDHNFIQDLGVGWALNFNVNFNQNLPEWVEYTPMLRFKPEKNEDGERTGNYILKYQQLTDDPDGLGPIVRDNPGSLWIIGNEVDRVYAQDDLMPETYAKAYHDAYHFIKERDPSAQIAVSGLVQVTPGRLQYLDLVWDSYREQYGTTMPVDVWNMHIYILAERFPDGRPAEANIALGTDPDLAIWGSGLVPSACARDDVYCYAEHDDMDVFAQQVIWMRQWMKAKGQQDKPLILSEYSLLFDYEIDPPDSCFLMDEFGECFTPERVAQFVTDSFAYLETATDQNIGFPADNNRLVQQWLWFTVNWEGRNFSSDLLEDGYTATDYTLRLPGERFVSEVNSLRPFSANTFIDEVSYPTADTAVLSDTASVNIAATLLNNGNTATTTPITVTFYADQAKTEEIGTAVISSPLGGCARRSVQAQVTWANLEAGKHDYWAEVEGGNTVKGFVLINPEQVFLPTLQR